jgi:hypothetical protein
VASFVLRQLSFAFLAANAGQALAINNVAAGITARDLEFSGNPLWLVGIGAFVVAALFLTCWGALRSDRGDRGFSSARRAGHGGPVYADIDDDDHPHVH